MFFNQFRSDTDDMLTLPILDHVEGLKCGDDVILCDGCHQRQVSDRQRPFEVTQNLQQDE